MWNQEHILKQRMLLQKQDRKQYHKQRNYVKLASPLIKKFTAWGSGRELHRGGFVCAHSVDHNHHDMVIFLR